MLNCFLELRPQPLHSPVKVNMSLLPLLDNANAVTERRGTAKLPLLSADLTLSGDHRPSETVQQGWPTEDSREHHPTAAASA